LFEVKSGFFIRGSYVYVLGYILILSGIDKRKENYNEVGERDSDIFFLNSEIISL